LFLTSIIVANGFWDTLDTATQEIMKDAALNAARIERRESIVDVASVKETLGNRVIEMSASETDKFKTATEVVYTKYADYFSNDLINKIKSA
jgi:TRAP-type C4-dicarboxylate transport system substrate-binding protein